jgi:hypothetical protein
MFPDDRPEKGTESITVNELAVYVTRWYQPVAETLGCSAGVLVLIRDRDRVDSGSRLPRRLPVAVP